MNWLIVTALSMFVTPEGEHQFRFVPESKLHMQELSREMGNQRLCPKGWEIVKEDEMKVGRKTYKFYEGRCK